MASDKKDGHPRFHSWSKFRFGHDYCSDDNSLPNFFCTPPRLPPPPLLLLRSIFARPSSLFPRINRCSVVLPPSSFLTSTDGSRQSPETRVQPPSAPHPAPLLQSLRSALLPSRSAFQAPPPLFAPALNRSPAPSPSQLPPISKPNSNVPPSPSKAGSSLPACPALDLMRSA